MRFLCLFILVMLVSLITEAQTFQYNKFWIEFTDKVNSPFDINSPEEFLSPKAVERRSLQQIAVDETDIPVVQNYVNAIQNAGAKVLTRSKWLNAISVETTDSTVLNLISSFPFVKQIHVAAAIILPDSSIIDSISIESVKVSNNKSVVFKTEVADNNTVYGNSFNQINMMNGDYLHELGFKGEGIDIAVLDAGFSKVDELDAFDSLWINGRILGTFDYVEGSDSVFHGSSHGMSVLSVMGGNLPGQLVGTAPNANYWLFRTEDVRSEYRIEEFNWIAAAEYADSVGADIINSSLGYSTFNDTLMNYTYESMDGNSAWITKGADMAAKKGMIVVSSAGNLGSSKWKYVSAPADGDSVISIGAVDANGRYVSFSSQGPAYDGRIKPNVVAQGKDDVIANTNNTLSQGNGTSYAAPLVAGLAACFWQANPGLNNMEVIKKIEESASQFPFSSDTLGYGIPDFLEAYNRLLEQKSEIYVTDNLPRAYPNPFRDILNVMTFAIMDGNTELSVFDSVGKKVYSEERFTGKNRFTKFDLPVAGILQNGMYIIRVKSNGSLNFIKVMKL